MGKLLAAIIAICFIGVLGATLYSVFRIIEDANDYKNNKNRFDISEKRETINLTDSEIVQDGRPTKFNSDTDSTPLRYYLTLKEDGTLLMDVPVMREALSQWNERLVVRQDDRDTEYVWMGVEGFVKRDNFLK